MKYKVFVADDKPLIRESIIKTIDWDTMDCIISGEADNGIVAYELIKKDHPDIVITDIKMPGMDGLELIRKLRDEFENIEVIIITGYQEFEYARQALRLGVRDIITKPIDCDQIIENIRSAIEEIELKVEKANWTDSHREEYSIKIDAIRRLIENNKTSGDKRFICLLPKGKFLCISVSTSVGEDVFDDLLKKFIKIQPQPLNLIDVLYFKYFGKWRIFVFIDKKEMKEQIKNSIPIKVTN